MPLGVLDVFKKATGSPSQPPVVVKAAVGEGLEVKGWTVELVQPFASVSVRVMALVPSVVKTNWPL